MEVFKAIFRFYINASIHVALAVVALCVFACRQYDLTIDFSLLVFIFLSSITAYNFVKYAPLAKLYHKRLTDNLKQIQVFSFLVFIGLVVSVFYIDLQIIAVCSIMGLLTLLYALPVRRRNLREIALLKVFVIALIWATTTYLLPFLNESILWNDLGWKWYFNYFEHFVWVVMLMIPFEIRDLKYDRKHIKTIVSVMGVFKTKVLSFSIILLLAFYRIFIDHPKQLWVYIFVYLSLLAGIGLSKEVQKPYYSSFFIEALPVFWMILTLL
jgi:hypothetical protein